MPCPDAFDAVGRDPDERIECLDVLVPFGGALRRPWVRVTLDPATGAVLDADIAFSR